MHGRLLWKMLNPQHSSRHGSVTSAIRCLKTRKVFKATAMIDIQLTNLCAQSVKAISHMLSNLAFILKKRCFFYFTFCQVIMTLELHFYFSPITNCLSVAGNPLSKIPRMQWKLRHFFIL